MEREIGGKKWNGKGGLGQTSDEATACLLDVVSDTRKRVVPEGKD